MKPLMKFNKVTLNPIALEYGAPSSASFSFAVKPVAAKLQRDNKTVLLSLETLVEISAGQKIEITLT
jgi:hypothetical protein